MKVIELFAGVGGFRVGLSNASLDYDFVWANQWEPSSKNQPSHTMYEKNYGVGSCANKDITTVDAKNIPDHDLLTGGFPCQDYSVAKSLKYSNGIEGKKGVLWWEIHRIIEAKQPKYILLENVDRLISSSVKKKGKDFAIILSCLSSLGYFIEWRVVNAADYGMPQKRKRVFIFATNKKSDLFKKIKKDCLGNSVLSEAFPMLYSSESEELLLDSDVLNVSNHFGNNKKSPFKNAGYCFEHKVVTYKAIAETTCVINKTLGDCLESSNLVPSEYWISDSELEKWKPFKLGRKIMRKTKEGHEYLYSEGKMAFPDSLNKPARTIITGEGGKSPSRFKHIILQDDKYRRLMPIELERINMFPDNHTLGSSDIKRAFMMGNALVTGVVKRIGEVLIQLP